MGCTVGDYDNDGSPDLYVLGVNGNVLYHNERGNGFADATEKAGLAGGRWSTSAAFVDYDRDGNLDLYVANNIQVDVRKSRRCRSAGRTATTAARASCAARAGSQERSTRSTATTATGRSPT